MRGFWLQLEAPLFNTQNKPMNTATLRETYSFIVLRSVLGLDALRTNEITQIVRGSDRHCVWAL